MLRSHDCISRILINIRWRLVWWSGISREIAGKTWNILNICYGIFGGLLEFSKATGKTRSLFRTYIYEEEKVLASVRKAKRSKDIMSPGLVIMSGFSSSLAMKKGSLLQCWAWVGLQILIRAQSVCSVWLLIFISLASALIRLDNNRITHWMIFRMLHWNVLVIIQALA